MFWFTRLAFWPVWLAASLGAVIFIWLGYTFKERVAELAVVLPNCQFCAKSGVADKARLAGRTWHRGGGRRDSGRRAGGWAWRREFEAPSIIPEESVNRKPPNKAKRSGPRPKGSREANAADRPPVPARADGTENAPSAAEASGTSPTSLCPVVGVGASAGGIEALIRLFEAMPSDSGMAFLIVMHLDPTRESQLAPLLGQHTAMPVTEAADGAAIEPDHVYVIAPDSALTIDDRRLRLTEPTERRGVRYPVDRLFESLAKHRRERAICIVLSGSGSDGTEGLKEVKAQGGCILVQDPSTARFDSMPRSAIAADLADQVIAPEHMPHVLMRYIAHAYISGSEVVDETTNDPSIDPVLALLRSRAGHDFRLYKRNTLKRRIHRRMGLNNLHTLAEYVELLRTRPGELETLTKDLMINDTGFFRDPEAWTALDETVLAPLVDERDSGAAVRLWIPACATGEEAYSLAMLLVDRAEAANKQFDIKLFATDGREDNLAVPRASRNHDVPTAQPVKVAAIHFVSARSRDSLGGSDAQFALPSGTQAAINGFPSLQDGYRRSKSSHSRVNH